MLKLIKKYAVFIFSLLASGLISWSVDFNALGMDKIQSFISLFFTIFVTMYVLLEKYKKSKMEKKTKNKKGKKKTLEEKIALSQKQVKLLTQSLNPEQQAEEVYTLLENIKKEFSKMTKIKNFFKDLFYNKATYTSTLITIVIAVAIQIATFTEYLYKIPFCAEHELVIKIIAPILSVIWVFIDLYTTWTKYGRETAEEYKARQSSKLTKEQKKQIKENLEALNSSLEQLLEKHSTAIKFVNGIETLVNKGYVLSSSEAASYQETKSSIPNIEKTISALKAEIAAEKENL